MKNVTKVVWGIILIILGTIIAINSLGFAKIDIFFDGWWTLFIIIPSLASIMEGKDIKGSLFGLILGIMLFLAAQGFISFRLILKLIIPLIIICIGFSIIFDGLFDTKVKKKVEKAQTSDLESVVGVFAEERRKIDYEFKGAVVEAVFGTVRLDLRDAIVKEEAIIKISAIFGGVEVLVPDDVEVKVKANRVFGGVENLVRERSHKKKNSKEDTKKIIYIDAYAMFGGVNIK